MTTQIETLGTLERRVSMSLPAGEVDRKVSERLQELARSVRMPGFRPGKVPMKMLERQYGPQVRSEVLSDALGKAFETAVNDARLKVAGQPRIEPRQDAAEGALEFNATFEVFPEVKPGDIATAAIEKPVLAVDEAAVERTLEILRKQRALWQVVERGAENGDKLTVDFEGRIDDAPFQGGTASDFVLGLGEEKMLPEFEAAARGMRAGETREFDLAFPADYHARDIAGRTARFTLTMKRVEAPQLPALDAEFAKSLGVPDGDLARMRAEVRENVEREVARRIEARLKSQALQALLDVTPLDLPKALVAGEAQQMVQRMSEELQARGMKLERLPLDPAAVEAGARRRVALGLIIAELARAEGLQPKPQQVRALIEAEARSFENPAEVVKWFYMQPQRLSEMEGLALEANVVGWVLSKARVTDKPVSFDDLMSGST